MCVTDEIGRDNFFIGIAENAFQWTLGGIFDRRTDVLVFRLGEKTMNEQLPGSMEETSTHSFAQTSGEINNGHVRCWNTESHAGEFAVQVRNDFADSFSGTC